MRVLAVGLVLALATLAIPPASAAGGSCAGSAVTLLGTAGNDLILGTIGADVIDGLAGDDVIYGNNGNDIICGGAGRDYVQGGFGDDTLLGDDIFVSLGGSFTGAADTLYGDFGADTLYGEYATGSAATLFTFT